MKQALASTQFEGYTYTLLQDLAPDNRQYYVETQLTDNAACKSYQSREEALSAYLQMISRMVQLHPDF